LPIFFVILFSKNKI